MNKNAYIFAGESYMVKESLKKLKQTLKIEYPEFNITEYKTMPKAQEFIDACFGVPFMSDKRLITVTDCTVLTAKGSKDEAKTIAQFLQRLPETTVIALCTDDTPDKRRTLYAQVKKIGTAIEFTQPSMEDCIRFVQHKAKENSAEISSKAASELVKAAGCDYYILDGETAKLAAYSGYGTITETHIKECASMSLEYNVFEIHALLIKKQASRAKTLLEDILRSERPEGLIGLIARKIRDMYKMKSMAESGYSIAKSAAILGFKSFVAEMILKDAKGFTQPELRYALTSLADLDYSIKSGEKDAFAAIPQTILKIYKL